MAGKPHIIHTATPAGHGTATSHASRVNGQWLSVQAQEAIANMRVHRSFDDARDPLMAKQLAHADREQSESKHRDDTDNGGQKRRLSDHPTTQHGIRRKGERARKVDSPKPQSKGWLKAHARNAMASVPQQIAKTVRDDTPRRKPANNNPNRGRRRGYARDGPQPYHGPSM